ncbi:MAG: AraC family transcriptional regulator [Pseudoxanthomonas sp.]
MLQRTLPNNQHASVPTGMLCRLVQIAGERSIDSSGWFHGLHLTPAEIDDPATRVSYRQAVEFITRALQALDQPDLGLLVGRQQNAGNFGLIGMAMQTAQNFGEAVQLALVYQRVAGTLMQVELEDGPAAGEVALLARAPEVPAALLPFLCEELFSSSTMVARELLGDDFRPLRLTLTYPAPAHAEQYAALFGCEVRFNQPCNLLAMDKAWMAVGFPGYTPFTARLAQELCQRQLDAIGAPHGEIAASVERYLRQRLPENPSLAAIAEHLHLSERTLRRHLAAEGAGFNSLHDRIRTERALELLRDANLSVAHIGARIGFSDPREFRRAFKRWTGRTPSEARAGMVGREP